MAKKIRFGGQLTNILALHNMEKSGKSGKGKTQIYRIK